MRRLCVILMCFMMVYGCSDLEDTWDRWMGNDDDDDTLEVATVEPEAETEPKEDPEPLPTPKTKTKVTKSNKFHHYNPQAWHGKGVALVLCYGAKRMDRCSINGKAMPEHGGTDKGRYVYSHYGDPGQGGTITCTRGGTTFKFKVKGGKKIQYGSCG